MIRIGFIDDETANYEDYAKRLSRRDIDLLFYSGDSNAEDIVSWLIAENLECLLIDYDLRKKSGRI